MKTRVSAVQRAATMVIGTALFIIGLSFAVLGATLFPVVGILIAFPIIWLAFHCFRPAAWINETESGPEPAIMEETWVEESMAA